MPFCQFCGKTLLNEGDRCGCDTEREISGEGDALKTSEVKESEGAKASEHEPINRRVARMLSQENIPSSIKPAGEPTLILNKDGTAAEKSAKNKGLTVMIAAASVIVAAGTALLVLYGLGYIGG